MEEYPRARQRRKNRKKKRRMGCGGCLLSVLLILLLAFGLFAWKVYSDLGKTSDQIYKKVDTVQLRKESVTVSDKKPVSVLLLGVDTGDLGRTEQGRSDTVMVMTMNPHTNHSILLSIPRDTRTEIVGKGMTDKINHAYAYGGVAMSVNTVQNLLDVPMDYYVEVNMQGLRDIVDAVGGVDIVPNNTFTLDGYSYTKGQETHLTSETVLPFVRERSVDSDFGRQERQRIVIKAILNKVVSLDSVMKYQNLLETLGNNVQTNLTFEELQAIFANYRKPLGNLKEIQMQGTGAMIDGVYYNVPDSEQLQQISSQLKTELEIQ